MFIGPEAYGTGFAFDSIHQELNQLEISYHDFLQQESLIGTVSGLKMCIEECLQGSPEAANYVHEHGSEILQDIKEKLKGATSEQSRLLEETPVLQNATGEATHNASRAAALVVKTQTNFNQLLNHI